MGQRKLTDKELQKVLDGRHCLRKVLEFSKHVHYIGVALEQLDEIAIHCTTDGKPYVEPQPEIGEGYRVATLSDAHRRDRQVWCDGFWLNAQIGHTETNRVYSVAKDRIPTDEDARQRPTVMVRDREDGPWLASKLLGVVPEYEYQFASNMCGVTVTHRMARFPYPGELD
jgi:hypothetical protein